MSAPTGPTARRHLVERPVRPFPGLRGFARDIGPLYAANGLIGLVFAGTGPVAVILAVGAQGGLSQTQLASWIFGAFFLNGVLTVAACWIYRQPLAFFWTIPGAVLLGPALGHLAWPEVVTAFVVTGLLIVVLGLTGLVRRAMAIVPMPIVMAMVAGVFLRFGVDLVRSLRDDAAIAAPMVVVFLLLSALPVIGRRVPPIIAALVAGVLAVAVSGRFAPGAGAEWLAAPVLQAPQWSWQAVLELVVPLAITVLVVQNGQGVAVLRAAGHEPPVTAITLACGGWSLLGAAVGAVSTCLTGPTNALLVASGKRERQYTAGVVCGLLAMVFGLFAPLFTRLMLAMPGAFIAALGGLAMLRVLQTSFVTAFGGRFGFAALITFVVTVSGVEVLSIGSPFWGLVAGLAVGWLLERPDFAEPGTSP
ncbi:benzoate/H(+) symporter BenE family transporter [Pseudonocardia lacus]|uniref:benzoate/H(+) symporter BenE family transporter n=1 Tax=Pseudonocardia lacus TaxID=2835865 RepID=UPI0027E28674|nr:benzoate/H(+) symporter BenE family transporter [Pseudonocardia lacus]